MSLSSRSLFDLRLGLWFNSTHPQSGKGTKMKDRSYRFAMIVGGIMIFACLAFLGLLFAGYALALKGNFPVSRLEVGDRIWVMNTQCTEKPTGNGIYVVVVSSSERVSKVSQPKMKLAYVSARRVDYIEIVWIEKPPPP